MTTTIYHHNNKKEKDRFLFVNRNRSFSVAVARKLFDTIQAMEEEGLKASIFLIFILGCGLGFYLAQLFF